MHSTAKLRQFCYPRSSGHCIDSVTRRNNGLRCAREEASRGEGGWGRQPSNGCHGVPLCRTSIH